MDKETKECCLELVKGYASAQRKNLWDRHGTDYFGREDRPRPMVIMPYWCPSIRVNGKQNGVIGLDGYKGYYTRKEAVAQAQAFIDKCRALLEEDAKNNTEDRA
jgi:hypothetical protein